MTRIRGWASMGSFASAVLLTGCATRIPSNAATSSPLADERRLPPLEGTYEVQAPDARLAFDDAIHGEPGPFAMLTGGADAATTSAPTAPSGEAAESQEAGGSLEQKVQNPLANLISVPFQFNVNTNSGPTEARTQVLLNVQPVIPVKLSPCWTLINRPIIPVPWIEEGWIPGDDAKVGLGDVVYQGYFSPTLHGHWTIGAGPVISFPTANEDFFGTGKWAAGPGVVVVWQPNKRWTIGAIANNLWSFAGDEDRADVNFFTTQPFASYQLGHGWNLSTGPLITANWEADSSNRWTVPVGGGFGRVMKIGKLHVSWAVQAYYDVERANGAPDWSYRFTWAFLFPK